MCGSVRASLRATTVACLTATLCCLAACDNERSTTHAQAADAARAGTTDAAQQLGSAWHPVLASGDVSAVIARRCGDVVAGLGAPALGRLDDATSPVLFGEPRGASDLYEPTHVRTAVVAYRDGKRAKAAFRELAHAPLAACVLDAVTDFVHADYPDRSRVPDPTAESIQEGSREASAGDEATMLTAEFDEDIIGGFDNTRDVMLFVARSGSVIATAIVAKSSQLAAADHAAHLARQLGVSALGRATASID